MWCTSWIFTRSCTITAYDTPICTYSHMLFSALKTRIRMSENKVALESYLCLLKFFNFFRKIILNRVAICIVIKYRVCEANLNSISSFATSQPCALQQVTFTPVGGENQEDVTPVDPRAVPGQGSWHLLIPAPCLWNICSAHHVHSGSHSQGCNLER